MTSKVSKIHFEKQTKLFGIELTVLKVFLPSFIVGGMALVFFVAIIFPKIAELPRITEEASALELKTTDVKKKYDYLQKVNTVELQEKKVLLNQAIPEDKDIYFLLNLVGQVALKNQYQVDSFSVAPGEIEGENGEAINSDMPRTTAAKKGPLSSIPLTFTAVGPSTKYIDFVSALEQSVPLISITQLSFTTQNDLTTLKVVLATNTASRENFPRANSTTNIKDLAFSDKENSVVEKVKTYQSLFGLVENNSTTQEPESKQFVDFKRNDPFN